MKETIFKQSFEMSHECHQSHLIYRVYVGENCNGLNIKFGYTPIPENKQESVVRSLVKEEIPASDYEEGMTIRNLLTLSINDPTGFRGAHHYFNDTQEIMIGESSSLGFLDGAVNPGYWDIIISVHGLFSDNLQGYLEVEADYHEPNKRLTPLSQIEYVPILKDRSRDFSIPLKSYKAEMHSHTVHSDAPQTAEELFKQADEEEIDWLAVTDHNTISAFQEIWQHSAFDTAVSLITGIEMTTFYGHFLIHGPYEHILSNFSNLNLTNLTDWIHHFKDKQCNITIAHPFDGGNPYCTGCRWDFPLNNLQDIDAIEVWNGKNPHLSQSNQQAYERWESLLIMGYEIAASAGRDWHRLYPDQLPPYTYVLAEEGADQASILEALSLGRSYISVGPLIDFKVNQDFTIGDRLPEDLSELKLDIELENLPEDSHLQVLSKHGEIYETAISSNRHQETLTLKDFSGGFVRLVLLNKDKQIITLTNPIYQAKGE